MKKEIKISNSIHVVPTFQAKTTHIKPQSADDITLLIQPYPGGKIYSVPKVVYEKILTKILGRLHELERDTDYTATELCTNAFWENEIDQSEHKCAGKYISLMVKAGRLPMGPNGIDPSSKAKLYRLE